MPSCTILLAPRGASAGAPARVVEDDDRQSPGTRSLRPSVQKHLSSIQLVQLEHSVLRRFGGLLAKLDPSTQSITRSPSTPLLCRHSTSALQSYSLQIASIHYHYGYPSPPITPKKAFGTFSQGAILVVVGSGNAAETSTGAACLNEILRYRTVLAVLTISRLTRWSIRDYNDTAATAKQARCPRPRRREVGHGGGDGLFVRGGEHFLGHRIGEGPHQGDALGGGERQIEPMHTALAERAATSAVRGNPVVEPRRRDRGIPCASGERCPRRS